MLKKLGWILCVVTLWGTACSWTSPSPQPVSSPPKETVKPAEPVKPEVKETVKPIDPKVLEEWKRTPFANFVAVDMAYQQEQRAHLLAYLKSSKQQGKRIASFQTSLRGHNAQPRVHNIQLAAKKISHTILLPGDEFSFNDLTGDSNDPRAGWQQAPQIVNKKLVPGYGGGICQVSTTIYNAVDQAKVSILERHHHSLPVSYVRPGRDATVSYPYLNLRFQNTRENPIRVDVLVQGGKVICNVYELTVPKELPAAKNH